MIDIDEIRDVLRFFCVIIISPFLLLPVLVFAAFYFIMDKRDTNPFYVYVELFEWANFRIW